MFQTFRANAGTSILFKSLSNGHMIRGIVINNVTGGWLYVVSEQQYVPPYTIGWSMPLTYAQASISVNYLALGPTAQVSTQQVGTFEQWELELHDEPVDASTGGQQTQYVEQFTPTLFSSSSITPSFPGGSDTSTQIAGVLNKRIRILQIAVAFSSALGVHDTDGFVTNTFTDQAIESPIHITIFQQDGVTNPQIWGTVLDRIQTKDRIAYAPGLDLALSQPLGKSAENAGFTRVHYDITVQYQLI